MKRLIAAAAAAIAVLSAGTASAVTIVDYNDGVAGQTEGYARLWTLVDDGNGGLAASTTRAPGKAHIALLFEGIHRGMTFTPTFGADLDHDSSDKFTDEARSLVIIFPQGGYLGPGDRQYYAPGERVAVSLGGYLFAFADVIWIDDVVFERTDVSGLVPEPATWAMMIAGFGLAGAAMRRQRSSIRAA